MGVHHITINLCQNKNKQEIENNGTFITTWKFMDFNNLHFL